MVGRGFHVCVHQLRFQLRGFVIDVFTREILAYVVDTRATKSLVIRTLSRPGVIHYLDAGLQYASTDLCRLLVVYQMDGSIGTVGDVYDNAMMESTIGLYKSELIDFGARNSVQSKQRAISDCVQSDHFILLLTI